LKGSALNREEGKKKKKKSHRERVMILFSDGQENKKARERRKKGKRGVGIAPVENLPRCRARSKREKKRQCAHIEGGREGNGTMLD